MAAKRTPISPESRMKDAITEAISNEKNRFEASYLANGIVGNWMRCEVTSASHGWRVVVRKLQVAYETDGSVRRSRSGDDEVVISFHVPFGKTPKVRDGVPRKSPLSTGTGKDAVGMRLKHQWAPIDYIQGLVRFACSVSNVKVVHQCARCRVYRGHTDDEDRKRRYLVGGPKLAWVSKQPKCGEAK